MTRTCSHCGREIEGGNCMNSSAGLLCLACARCPDAVDEDPIPVPDGFDL